MNETIRIKTTPNGSDTYLKTPISQDFDFIEILSLKISQEDVYRRFCSDYGVIVGRVSINQGFGVPNAKVSVFIPIDEIDINNPEIKGLYPYEVITDKNSDGIRYNLLTTNPDEADDCFTPVGSFPSKNEILDNPHLEYVYDKYYKFTTTTNHAGDFMIFGVPLGSYTVHVDADISNIGIASQRPYDLISQGAPLSMFETSTKFKADKNLNKLPQIKTLNSGVNVQPFWGDVDSCEIGITRLDFDLNYNLIPSAIFVGSIFGDEGKHSVNKNCQPNKNVGQICEQVVTSGSINMIRKSFTGEIEEFDINGGRVIDEEGAWAYQIPMNLDYMITDENGTLVFSDDPTKGIPTRARVRFNIGMDENGGEGRLRMRARYLVPNNPTKESEIDYSFGSETKDTSFRDLYWNKIYTVSNYISRYQPSGRPESRATTGIKNVDNCVGAKNPFPYNKVDSNINPLFFIICLIIQVIELMIRLINGVIALINGLIAAINAICNIKILGSRPFRGLCLDYIPCISVKCEGQTFAPGCSGHGDDTLPPDYLKEGMDNCFLFLIAGFLRIYELDFYNDWINGSLFSYLVKYKKRKSNEKFCDYECDTNDSSESCHHNFLVESCIGDDEDNVKTFSIREGLIKKFDGEFYYAATTHDTNHKMFATEIVNLGSVFECDWQGIPKINNALVSSSYIIPPDFSEYDDNGNREACGMTSLNKSHDNALFFTINCLGTDVDKKGCLNLRHICEIGVNISEAVFDDNGVLVEQSNCFIGAEDINDVSGTLFRDVFFSMNNSLTPWIGIKSFENRVYTTDFNTKNIPEYDYTSKNDNGVDYIDFRGYTAGLNDFNETKHSYYFYFGLIPGKTALDKMNSRFFTTCKVIEKNVLTIISNVTPDLDKLGSGTIKFKFVGGKPNYSYNVTGPNYQTTGTTDNSEVLLTGLFAGSYQINAFDSFNTPVSKTVVVSGPKPLSAFAYVSKNASSVNVSDGQITISNVSGGLAPYSYMVTKSNGDILVPTSSITNLPVLIDGLPSDDVVGHTVIVTDSNGATVQITGLKISGVPLLTLVTTSVTHPICFNDFSGEIFNQISGGQPPYKITTTGPNDFTSGNINLSNLGAGTYETTVTDSLTGTTPVSVVNTLVASSPEIVLSLPTDSSILRKQCNPLEHTITVFASFSFNAPSSVLIGYVDENTGDWIQIAQIPYVNSTTPLVFTYPNINAELLISIKLDNCFSNVLTIANSMVSKPSYPLVCNITQSGPVNGTYSYNVTGSGGIGSIQGTGIFTSTLPTYTATITDSVGCTATKTI